VTEIYEIFARFQERLRREVTPAGREVLTPMLNFGLISSVTVCVENKGTVAAATIANIPNQEILTWSQ